MMGNMVRPVMSMSRGRVQKQCCEEYIMVEKTFCKSTDGSCGRSLMCRKGKSVPRGGVYSLKNKILPLPRWKQFSIINLPSGSWLITLENGAIWGLSVGLCCWQMGLSSGCSQVSLGKWNSILLSHTSHLSLSP